MTATIIDWTNKCCAKCRKPMVREDAGPFGGWRLDCSCWDEPAKSEVKGRCS